MFLSNLILKSFPATVRAIVPKWIGFLHRRGKSQVELITLTMGLFQQLTLCIGAANDVISITNQNDYWEKCQVDLSFTGLLIVPLVRLKNYGKSHTNNYTNILSMLLHNAFLFISKKCHPTQKYIHLSTDTCGKLVTTSCLVSLLYGWVWDTSIRSWCRTSDDSLLTLYSLLCRFTVQI